MQARIQDIESHLERADAIHNRFVKIERVRELRRKRKTVIRTIAGIIAALCALYAIFG